MKFRKKMLALSLSLVLTASSFLHLSLGGAVYAESAAPKLEDLNKEVYLLEKELEDSFQVYYQLKSKQPRVTVEKDGVIYGTNRVDLTKESADAYEYYDEAAQNMVDTGMNQLYTRIFMGSEPTAGKYDIVISDGSSKEVLKDKFVIHNQTFIKASSSWDYQNYIGLKKVYGNFTIENGKAEDFKASLLDKDGKVVSDQGQLMVTDYNSRTARGRVVFDLKEALKNENGPYKIEYTSTKPLLGEKTSEARLNDNEVYMLGKNTSQNDYACFVAWLNKPVTGKIQASLYGEGKEVAQMTIDADNTDVLDFQFLDASGKALKLKPGYYNVNLFMERYNLGEIEKEVREEHRSEGSYSSYINYGDGLLYANIVLTGDLAKTKTQKDKWMIEIQNVITEKAPLKLTGWTLKDEKTIKEGKIIYLEKKIGKEVPRAMYTAKAYYDSKEVKDAKGKNTLASDWPFDISDVVNQSLVWAMRDYVNETELISGAEIKKGAFKIANLKMQLIPISNIYGKPAYEIPLKVDKDGSNYSILKANAAKVDFYNYYIGRLVNNGKVIGEFAYRDEKQYRPIDEKADAKDYTVKAGTIQNGSLTFDKTKAKKGQEVMVMVKASPGYAYKANSIKVNGKAIDGRFFILKENATVTAEFIPQT